MSTLPENKKDCQVELSQNWSCTISAKLYANRNIAAEAKILYLMIKQLTFGKQGCCTASNETLGHFLGRSGRQVQEHLKTLREEGWITVQIFDGYRRKIYVREERRDVAQALERIDTDPSQKLLDKEFDKYDNADEEIDNTEEPNAVDYTEAEEKTISSPAREGHEEESEAVLMDVFEKTLWKHPRTPAEAREGSKKSAFDKWKKITNKNKKLVDELQEGWLCYVTLQQERGLQVKRLEFFLTPNKKIWEQYIGKNVSMDNARAVTPKEKKEIDLQSARQARYEQWVQVFLCNIDAVAADEDIKMHWYKEIGQLERDEERIKESPELLALQESYEKAGVEEKWGHPYWHTLCQLRQQYFDRFDCRKFITEKFVRNLLSRDYVLLNGSCARLKKLLTEQAVSEND